MSNPLKLSSKIAIGGFLIALLSLSLHPQLVQAFPNQRPLWAPVPSVTTLNVPATPFIGDTLTLTLTFDNTDPTDTGYGPYIDLFLPLSGADGTSAGGPNDGISFVSANYLGASVTTNVLNCPAGGNVTHPLTGQNIPCPAQPPGLYAPFVWQLVVITLPFGSFVPDQPPAPITVNAQLSSYADAGVPLPIQAQSGFMFGADPLNNPITDPPIQGAMTSASVTPSLFTLQKSYSGPEDETATGPNFPRRYTVTATIAPGQTMTSFNLSDILPNNMQFVSLISTTPGGATCTLPSTTTPGGTLSCDFASVSGTVTMTFEYYIPLRDSGGASVIDPSTGDDALSCNNASGGGTWTPLDSRDIGQTFTQDPAGCEHTLTDKSIAIQKGVSVVGGGQPKPGAVLEYTLDFQISDFFAFNGVIVTDTISDGQHFNSSFTPTLQINGNTYTLTPAAFNAVNYDVTCNYTGGPGLECTANDPAANDGTTTLTFRVSDEIISRGQDGRLIGGCVPTGGVAGDPNCTSYNDGPTTGRIVFRTVIQENFTDTYPSGDPSVDQGDVLNNTVNITGNVLSTSNASTPTGYSETDNSAASVSILYGNIAKSIYAINGSTSFPTPVHVSPGDTVTYRITYTLPTSDFEDLVITDYLPLPVFNATEVTSFSNTVCGIPGAGASCLGPSDSYHTLSGAVSPSFSTNAGGNWVRWTYGDYDSPNNPSSTIDLLFTVTVRNDPFADGLYLTNQAFAQEGSTNSSGSEATGIVQITLNEPVLRLSKGVVWTNNPNGVFTPSTVGPVTFSPSCPAFSGTITSSGLASKPVNSNLSNVDASDQVMMAIVLENTGHSSAFDVRVRDSLPPDMTYVPGSLCVTDGTGAAISYTDLGGGLFGSGIELNDPGPTANPPGTLDPGKDSNGNAINNGRNIAVITYLVTLNSTVQGGQILTNTATLFNYAGTNGGPDHTTTDLTDDAQTQIRYDGLGKTFTTEIIDAYNSQTQVVIGEYIDYTLTIIFHEGTTPNVTLQEQLPSGLAFVDCLSITPSSGDLTTSLPGGFNDACNDPANPNVSAPGQNFTFTLGTITNSNTDNTVDETLTIVFRAVTLNVIGNQAGTNLVNQATLVINGGAGGTATVQSSPATVIEPTVNTSKSVSPTTADAGDTVTFTVTLSNPASGSTTAYDVTWSDTVQTGLTYVPGSLTLGACTASTPLTLSDAGAPTLTGSGGLFQPGQSCTITFQATVAYSVTPGQVITNTAQTQWTSINGPRTDYSSHNGDSDERTGADGVGGALNDYASQGAANLTINQVAPQKSIVATSEAHTGVVSGMERVTIGEIIRYRLVVQLPEGTSPNFQIQDFLPTGLTYLDDGTARLALLSNGVPIASTEPAGSTLGLALGSGPFGTPPWVNGNDPTLVTPTFPLPDQNVGSDNSITADPDIYNTGSDPFFKLGTLTNNDSDADAEYVIIEFNALVDNTTTGSNDAGEDRTNNFGVFINDSQNGPDSNPVTVRIAEPLLSLAKAVTTAPVDAGDPIIYTLTISAASGANRSTAFDLILTDTLDQYVTIGSVNIVPSSWTCVGNGGVSIPFSGGYSWVGSPTVVTVTANCLDPGQSITVTISGTVANNAPAGYIIPNTANLTWTSLPNTGTSPNPTGSTTPGGSGAPNGERDGSGGINDYTASANANAPLATPQIDKLNPSPTQYAIGQQVTFNILVTLPEGVTPALNVVDNLPTGLRYVSHQVITTAAGSGGLLAADYNGSFANTPPNFTCSGTCASGDDITLDFGDATTNADNVTNNNAFLVQVVAVVVNEAGNQNGTVLTNTATVSWTGGSASDSVNLTVIEPELDIAKTVDDNTPAFGQTLTYTLTVSHLPTSTATAYDIVVTDTIPAGLTYVSGSISAPAGWTVNDSAAPTLTWSCSAPCSLPVSNTAVLSYQATVASAPPPNVGDTLINTASMTWTSTDGTNPDERTGSGGINDYSDSSTQNVTLTYPDLRVTKTDGQTSYVPGSPVVYTIVVSNVGNGDAIGATVSDAIPPQITSWSWACTGMTGGASGCDPYSGNGNFTDVVDLPAGSSITYTVTAQTDPVATTNLTNTVTVAPPTGFTDPTPGNNSASDTDTPNPQADLSVSKDDGVTLYVPGSPLVYTIVVRNAGPSDVPGAVISDTLPTQFTSWTWDCTGSSGGASGCDPYSGSGNFSDTVNLPAGSSITYTVTAQVASSATGDLTNTVIVTPPAGVTDTDSSNNTASDTDTQSSQAAISVTKDDGVSQYVPGGTLTYTITVTNTGPSDALGVSVTDNIPSQFISWTWTCSGSTGGAGGCTGSGGPINTNFTDTLDLAAPFPSVITYTVTAQVSPAASDVLTNTVTVSHPADTDPADNSASDTDMPNFQANLYVTKDDGSATYTPGVGVTYTVTIGNNGPSNVSGAVLTDTLPAQATSWTWTCSGITGGASGCDGYGPGNANFSDTVDLPANSAITYTVTLTIPSSATGDLVNTATLTPPDGVTDPDPTDNSDTDTDTPKPQAALSVSKDDGVTEYVPGLTLTYTITVTNTGPSDALGVSVTDNIPPQFISWTWTCSGSTGGAGGCTGSGGPINTDFTDSIDLAGPFPSSITYTVTAQVAPSATGDLTNTVTISHPADSTPNDNSASDTDTPNPQVNLHINKDDGLTVIAPGSIITYTVIVKNSGPSDLIGALVSDPKPAQIVLWSWACVTSGGATCTPQPNLGGDFNDTVNLPVGSVITYTITASVDAAATSGTLVNRVTVTPPEGFTETDPSDNEDDDQDVIITEPQGDLVKAILATNQDFTPLPNVAIGEVITYEVRLRVPALSVLSDLVLTDVLDPGLAFLGCDAIITSSAAITTTLHGGFEAACNDPINPTVQTEPPGSSTEADLGRRITFSLGEVQNQSEEDGFIRLRYGVVVLNSPANHNDVSLENNATLTWSGGTLTTKAPEVVVVEPDFILEKKVDRNVALPGSILTFTITFRHSPQSRVDAFNVVFRDTLPPELTYVPGSLIILSGPPAGMIDDHAAPKLKVSWDVFPLLTDGKPTEAVIQFQAQLGQLPAGQKATNTASLEWSTLPTDVPNPQSPYNPVSTERYYGPDTGVDIFSPESSVEIDVPLLPLTGFPPARQTPIPLQPNDKAYTDLESLWLEIPKLGVKAPIVGIPMKGKEWDLSWLWDQVGWLDGTAFPTHRGNSALTAHVYLPSGLPGPFARLGDLRYSDQLIIHLGNQQYLYEVREVKQVLPNVLSGLRHEQYPWLTLITCSGYDERSQQYRYRIIVRAVLVKIED